MEQRSLLIVFLKNPVSGKVKTRLAAGIGDERALKIYLRLLKHTLAVSRSLPYPKIAWYSDFIPLEDDWKKAGFGQKLQRGKDLGEKMEYAFGEGFKCGYTKIIIIGSDCPELTTKLLLKAFDCLKQNDAVIGPAKDGGYYLLGLQKPCKAIFRNKSWSTSSVLSDTLNDFSGLKLSCQQLPVLSDIDVKEDLKM